MVIAKHVYFYVLKWQVSSSKDSRAVSIFMNTYYLLNKIKLKLKKKCIFNTVNKYILNRHILLDIWVPHTFGKSSESVVRMF